MNMRAARPYRMVRRAETTARTREAILDTATRLFWEEPAAELTLERIAGGAGVTVQTVLRHFASRDGVFEAAVARETARVQDERDPAAVETPADAVRLLVAHYERTGDRVLRLLAEESRSTTIAGILEVGRTLHRAWCEQVFAATLARLGPAARRRRLAQLVAVCDVQTWRLLRHDGGLDRRTTEVALLEILTPLLEVP